MKQQLIFGSTEAREVLQKQKDEDRHERGELNHDELIKMAAETYAALAIRNDCHECGGTGGDYVSIEDGKARWGVCQCTIEARAIVAKHGKWFEMVAAEYLGIAYHDLEEMDEGFVQLEIEVLRKAID